MNLTIIPFDKTVYKNGIAYAKLILSTVPSNIHALQWKENNGWIEYENGQPNDIITELPVWALEAENEWQVAYDEANKPPAPTPLVIPDTVSMRQARLALFQQGKLSLIQPLIDSMAEPAKTVTQISWDYATEVKRDDDLVIQLSAALGLTSADLDALFTLASTL